MKETEKIPADVACCWIKPRARMKSEVLKVNTGSP